jgi:formylglycine-generating enzyme required for sulfatase activity
VGLLKDGLPDLVWCPVDSGEELVGDAPGPVRVNRFYLARTPVTWAQYRIFLDTEDGHHDLRWWEGLRRRPEYEREADLRDNQPVQEVSWYDAVAYCRWLSAHTDYDVRLPTEAEWQHAATGGDPDWLFPWGRDAGSAHLGYANTRESLLRRVTAVGLYPLGESPVGALDMAGTVLEWCSDGYIGATNSGEDGQERRVLRGGSWFLILSYARTMFRTAHDPYLRFNSVGFRLAANSLEPRPKPVYAPAESETLAESSPDDVHAISVEDSLSGRYP